MRYVAALRVFSSVDSAVAAICIITCVLCGHANGQCPLLNSGGYNTYGESVSVSGNAAMVGSQNGVSVFRFDGVAWPLDQILLPPVDCSAGCRFGRFLAVNGSLAIIGAPDDFIFAQESGSAYIFRHNGTAWVLEQKLVPSVGAFLDRFGWDVAIDSNIAVAGAVNGEAAFVFRFDGSTWTEEQKLQSPQPGLEDNFGEAVAITGSTIFVGEPDWSSFTGRVHIFEYNGTEWEATQILPGGAPSEYFGFSLSVSGNAILIGSSNANKAWVYRDNTTAWVHEQTLVSSDADSNFGKSVSIDGNDLIVGALNADEPPATSGAAFHYQYDGLAWVEIDVLINPDGLAGNFGKSVAIDGDIVVIGMINRGFVFGPPAIAFDCNGNGTADGCDIENGTSEDINGNAVPDSCDLARGDLNLDGIVNVSDLLILLGFWGPCTGSCLADTNGDGNVNVTDLLTLLANWG